METRTICSAFSARLFFSSRMRRVKKWQTLGFWPLTHRDIDVGYDMQPFRWLPFAMWHMAQWPSGVLPSANWLNQVIGWALCTEVGTMTYWIPPRYRDGWGEICQLQRTVHIWVQHICATHRPVVISMNENCSRDLCGWRTMQKLILHPSFFLSVPQNFQFFS